MGGPVRKNKDFLFASFEGWQEVVPFPALASTPPTILRDGQHFTDLGYKVYDPLTNHLCKAPEPCQGQTYIRNQFPGNVIPANRISPIGQKILSYYPAPNAPGLNNNFVGSNVGRYYYEQPIIKWDHVFSESDRLNATYTYQRGYEYRDSTGFGKPAGSGNTDNERRDINGVLSWTHLISPRSVLDVRGSFGRFTQITPGYGDIFTNPLSATTIGMTGLPQLPTAVTKEVIVPQMNPGGYTRLFSSGSVLSRTPTTQWNLAPNLTMSRGRHTMRTGFEFNYVARAAINTGYANFTFAQSLTQQLPARSQGALDGSGVATLLLGAPTAGSIDYNDTFYRTRPYYAFYAQDDWRITERITLNLGLRYEVQLNWKERFNRLNRGFDPSVKSPLSDQIIAAWTKAKADYDKANPTAKYPYPAPPSAILGSFLFPGKGGQPERIYNTDWTNIAPRIGLAWRVAQHTVVRTGGGVYYQSPSTTGTTTGFSQSTPYTTSLDGGVTPSAGLTGPYSLVNPFPQGMFKPAGADGGALTGIGGGISFESPDARIPRTYQYSLGIQRSLGRHIVAEASFAGNYQIYIPFNYNMNHQGMANQLLAIADPAYYNRPLPNPFYGILPTTVSLGASATTTASALLRPRPIFSGSIGNSLIQQGHYRSDAMQVKIEQRAFGSGDASGVLTWVLSYTLSKAYEQNHRLNDWNDQEPPIYEIDNQDKPHNLSFSGVWDLPFGTNRKVGIPNRVANGILGNWRFTWIFTYLSGYPVGWPNLINNCGSWKAAKQTEDSWFNNDKSCYTQFPTNSLQTIPDRFPDIRNPAEPQLNAAVEKTFRFAERYRFLFRAEAFNAFNTPIRPGPSTSFTSVDFGKIPKSQNNFPRFFQLAAKFYF